MRLARVSLLPRNPIRLKSHVLDGFLLLPVLARGKQAVRYVHKPVSSLNNGRVVIAMLLRPFQMASPLPGSSFVVGHRDRQRMPAGLEIVVDNDPAPVSQCDRFDASSRVR